MKKKITIMLAILLAVAMAAALAGCKDDPPPQPEPTRNTPANTTSPSVTPSPSPTPSQSAAPSPAPVYDDDDFGLLETAERYYAYGDPNSSYCIFFSDNTVQDEYGEEGEFEVYGDTIDVYFNGNYVGSFIIIDWYTIEDEQSGLQWIREGGAGFQDDSRDEPTYVSTGLPPIIFGKYYYLDGDPDERSLYFWDDGDVDIKDGDDDIYCEYVYTGDEVVIIREGRVILILSVMNPAELEDVDSWDIYMFEDARSYELETNDRYYLNGDTDEMNFYFWSDGTIDFETANGDTASSSYYVLGYTVYIDIGGVEYSFEIVNSYILQDEASGDMLIRLP